MKNLLPILTGVSFALIVGVMVYSQYLYPKKTISPVDPRPQVAGLDIKYGDTNVKKLTKQEFLEKEFDSIVKNKSGIYSISTKVINEPFSASINGGERFFPASLYKIPVALGVLRNHDEFKIDLTDKVVLKEEHILDGSGSLKEHDIGEEFTVSQLLNYLIKQSDNTAQEMLIKKTDFSVVYDLMPKDSWVTPKDIVEILENLYIGDIVSDTSTSLLLNLMTGTSFDDRIHAGLPSTTRFAHKIGNWPESGTWHDCGIILDDKNIAVCVMSKNTTYEEFKEVTKEFGTLISEYFDLK